MQRWPELEQSSGDRGLAEAFAWLDARELEIVRRYVTHTERRWLRFAALWVNRLSNGMLYPLVAAIMLAVFGQAMLVAILVATGAVTVAHLIYPVIKRYCGRGRPCECDPTIASLLKPLDRHSFPSGHAMTATAAFMPLSVSSPQLLPLAIAGILSIGWARLAAGHHYPSDVVAGVMLGSLIVSPGVVWMLY
jgi:undecaprenyl-diphosphatase